MSGLEVLRMGLALALLGGALAFIVCAFIFDYRSRARRCLRGPR